MRCPTAREWRRAFAPAPTAAAAAAAPHRRTAFNEYQLCVEKRGKGDALCAQRGRDYVTVCPTKWISEWKDQAAAGTSMSVGGAFVKE